MTINLIFLNLMQRICRVPKIITSNLRIEVVETLALPNNSLNKIEHIWNITGQNKSEKHLRWIQI